MPVELETMLVSLGVCHDRKGITSERLVREDIYDTEAKTLPVVSSIRHDLAAPFTHIRLAHKVYSTFPLLPYSKGNTMHP